MSELPPSADRSTRALLAILRLGPTRRIPRYLVAPVAVAVATVLQLQLWPKALAPFVLLYPAIALAAFLAGRGPGLLGAAMGALAAAYYFFQPLQSSTVSPSAGLATLLFVCGAGLTAMVIGPVRDSLLLVAESARRLQASEQEHERTGRLLDALSDATPEALYTKDREGRVTFANPAAARALGKPLEQILGRPTGDWYQDRDEVARNLANDRRVMDSGQTQVVEERFSGPNGLRLYRSTKSPLRDASGAIVGVVGLSHDITELRLAQEKAAHLAAIVSATEDAVMSRDLSGTILTWNEGAVRLLGYAATEAIGSSVFSLIPPERHEEERRLFARLAEGAQVGHFESERLTKSGERMSVSISTAPLRAADGRVTGGASILRDISEQKRADRAIRRSERRWQQLADSMPQIVWAAGPDGIVDYHNRRWFELTGADPSGDADEEWITVLHPDDRRRTVDAWRQSVRLGEPFQLEYRFKFSGEGYRWFLGRALPARNEDGEIVRWYGTSTDIDDRKRVEDQLKQANEQLNFVQRAAEVGWWDWDLPSGSLTWSAQCKALFGISEDAPMSHERFLAAVHPDDRGRVDAAVRSALEGRPFDVELRVPLGEEGIRWIHAKGQAYVGPDGRAVRMAGVALDVTDRKRTEQELSRSEAALEAFFAASPGLLLLVDEQLRYVKTDKQAPMYFGLTREAMVGKAIAEVAPAYFQRFGAMMRQVIETGESQLGLEIETVVPSRPGESSCWRASHFPVPLPEGGRGIGVIGVEITDLKKTEGALRAANGRLRDADRMKNEFLGVLSHELRNPLSPIRNSVFLLSRSPPGSEQAKRALAVIERQSHQLVRLVDDLLDVTRIERGKIRLQRERVELGALVGRVAEDHRETFRSAGITFEVDVTQEQISIDADPARISQVVGNMLWNAAKFTHRGGCVTLRVRNAGERWAEIVVQDTGEGIAPEMLPRLFEPFVQADRTLQRNQGGLGLGLALVKGLVGLHGGTVEAQSEGLGKGATFSVRLPVEQREAPRLTLVQQPAMVHPHRVLLIEDNVDAAETMREVLEVGGHEVAVANTGPDGIARARAFHPDVVLCDIGLPGMDGFEVARELRAVPELRTTGLVALSGYGQPQNLERSRSAGFDLHLTKPAPLDSLETSMSEAYAAAIARAARG